MSEGLPPCQDFEICGNQSDPRFTIDFTSVEPGAYIHWCSKCGPVMHALDELLTTMMEEVPGFAKKLKDAIEDAKRSHNQ